MECIEQQSLEEQKRALNPSIRNEITRALGTHMFSYNPKHNKAFCTEVARMLVKKYPFMRNTGKKESGYVSIFFTLCTPLHTLTINVGVMGKKLIGKMHNLKAKKRASDSEGTPKAKRGRPKLSLVLTRYPPLRDTEDDE